MVANWLCSVSLVATAAALGASPTPARAQAPETEVGEIIVTAQRREQSLQDVPLVVTAVSGRLLRDAGVRDIKELTVLTPGLMVTSTQNEATTTARIRGVGTVGDNPGLESSVGVLIDGVYRPRNGVGFGDLGEVERIEVLKGPQGTLFGKNTSAGVINILTLAPEFEVRGGAEATFGSYGQKGFSAFLTGPLSQAAAGRVYVAGRRRDGFQNTSSGGGARPLQDMNQAFYTARAQLLFRPTEQVRVRLIADYARRDEDCCLGVNVATGALAPVVAGVAAARGRGQALLVNPDPARRLTFANRGDEQRLDDKGLQAQVDWRMDALGGATLTSITGMRDWSTVNGQDIDFTTADLLWRRPDGGYGRAFKTFSQELRLAGRRGPLDWLFGGFYAHERLKSAEQQIQGADMELYLDQMVRALATPGSAVQQGGLSAITGRPFGANAPAGLTQDDRYRQTSDSIAVFGNLAYKATRSLELTAGLRFTSEKKTLVTDFGGVNASTAGCALANLQAAAVLGGSLAAPNANLARLYAGYFCRPAVDPAFLGLKTWQKRREDELSGTLKLAWRFTPDVMAYLSYARGYKGGGFNLDRVRIDTVAANPSGIGLPKTDTGFAPEFVDSFELGAKTSWFGRSLLLNAALFHQTFKDFQLNAFDGVAFTVTTIPKVVSRGLDADLIWRTPVSGLSLQGGVTYAETQYADARPPGPKFALPSAANPAGGGLYRLPGGRVAFAPLWSASLSATFEKPVADGLVLRVNLSGKYASSLNTGSDLLPSKVQNELLLMNGRIGLSGPDERWAIELWGLNLTDRTYLQVAYDAPLQLGQVNGFLGPPRTWGATLRVRY